MTLWYWADPGTSQVYGNGNESQDPDGLVVVTWVVAENDSADDTTKVTCSTDETRDDTWKELLVICFEGKGKGAE